MNTIAINNKKTETNSSIVGENIKAFRVGMGLTQSQVADFLNVQRVIITYYESGQRTPNLDQMEKLADLFGIDLYDLLEEDQTKRIVNSAFAFRAGNVNEQQLDGIASFRRIVKNYLNMIEAERKLHV